jgi:DDE superfamily endonuclease
VIFEDEASFQLEPTLHRTWARRGQQPLIPTLGMRKTAHVFGAVALHDARFTWAFTDVFNGYTFPQFLKVLVRHYRRKVFLIIDNGPCHNLKEDGRAWLRANRHRIRLCRLPPYSPEFNPTEGVWKVTRKETTHNRFFASTHERDAALAGTFDAFRRTPRMIDAHVARFR